MLADPRRHLHAQLEPAARVGVLIAANFIRRNKNIVNRCQAQRQRALGNQFRRAHVNIRRIGRQQFARKIHRRIFQNAGGLARGIFFDHAAGGIGAVASDACEFQCSAVDGDQVPADVIEINRIFGRDSIKIMAIDVAMLGELRIIPARTGDPLPLRRFGRTLAHHRNDVGNRMDFGISDIKLIAQNPFGPLHRMCMYIYQTGQNGLAAKINDLRPRTGAASDLVVCAPRQDPAVANSQRRDNRATRIHRDDMSAAHNQISIEAWRAARSLRERADEHDGKQQSPQQLHSHVAPLRDSNSR